jgi:hypothetical protein
MDPNARDSRPLATAFVVALCLGATPPGLAADTRPDTIVTFDRSGSFEDQRSELLELRREFCVRFLARQPGRIILTRIGIDASSKETFNFSPSGPNGMIVETTIVSSMIVPMQDLSYVPPAEPEKGFSGPTFDALELLRTDGEPIPLNEDTDCAAVGRGGILVRLRNSKAGTSESW